MDGYLFSSDSCWSRSSAFICTNSLMMAFSNRLASYPERVASSWEGSKAGLRTESPVNTFPRNGWWTPPHPRKRCLTSCQKRSLLAARKSDHNQNNLLRACHLNAVRLPSLDLWPDRYCRKRCGFGWDSSDVIRRLKRPDTATSNKTICTLTVKHRNYVHKNMNFT